MTRPERSAIAAERQRIALELRANGITWKRIGEHLGVSAGRACQIANPSERLKPGNPQAGVSDVAPGTTVGRWLARRVAAVEECARAHGVAP